MALDDGGDEQAVTMNQLDCGMEMFTVLDGGWPNRHTLARLSTTPDFYFDPASGAPVDSIENFFVDEESTDSSRLFGQGASLWVRRYAVSSRPPKVRHEDR